MVDDVANQECCVAMLCVLGPPAPAPAPSYISASLHTSTSNLSVLASISRASREGIEKMRRWAEPVLSGLVSGVRQGFEEEMGRRVRGLALHAVGDL